MKTKLLAIAGVLVVLGVVLFLLQPGEPKGECAPQGTTSSGYVNDDGCAVTTESFKEIQDYRTSPKPFRIAGLVAVVAGLGCGVGALVKRSS